VESEVAVGDHPRKGRLSGLSSLNGAVEGHDVSFERRTEGLGFVANRAPLDETFVGSGGIDGSPSVHVQLGDPDGSRHWPWNLPSAASGSRQPDQYEVITALAPARFGLLNRPPSVSPKLSRNASRRTRSPPTQWGRVRSFSEQHPVGAALSSSLMLPVRGPAWSPPGLDIRAGRFPLQVEKHMLNMTGRLLPGVSTVTVNARYYSLHGLAVLEGEQRRLELDETVDLLRRMEVVFGAAALTQADSVISTPHGSGPLQVALATGSIDVAALSTPKTGYSNAARGFWGPYLGSEVTLGVVDRSDYARPGVRCDQSAIRAGLEGVVELAQQEVVTVDDLEGLSHLRLDASEEADGRWLLGLIMGPHDDVGDFAATDRARRVTATTLLRSLDAQSGLGLRDAFYEHVAYSAGAFDEPDEVAAWRGLLFRRFSVGAWRRLWQWLVEQLAVGAMSLDELVDASIDELPNKTVSEFVADAPPTQRGSLPANAEAEIRRSATGGTPATELLVLAAGARRVAELSGRARDSFLGPYTTLSPQWVADRLADWDGRPVRTFMADLTVQLVRRSQRIAMNKARLNPSTGRLWVPTRVIEREGTFFRTSGEGGGDVGLRVEQLGGMLASLGAIKRVGEGWGLTDLGEGLL
jgi:hypothetical protein